jgi:hypothetical protein
MKTMQMHALMRPFMYSDTRSAIHLRPGQTLCLHARTKMRFIIMHGQVSITEAPMWLGDRFLEQKNVLCEGDLCVVQRDGWMTVQALGFSEMICLEFRRKFVWEQEYRSGWRSLADALIRRMPAFCRGSGQKLVARIVGSVEKG